MAGVGGVQLDPMAREHRAERQHVAAGGDDTCARLEGLAVDLDARGLAAQRDLHRANLERSADSPGKQTSRPRPWWPGSAWGRVLGALRARIAVGESYLLTPSS